MSDFRLRNLRLQYMKNLLSASDFLAALRRGGAQPIWDWMAGNTSFYDLPLRDQVMIFEERWLPPVTNFDEHVSRTIQQDRAAEALLGTAMFNNKVFWLNGGPDAPSVGEVLAETLGDFSYYYGLGKSPVEWLSFEDFIATNVIECQHLIDILRHYNLV